MLNFTRLAALVLCAASSTTLAQDAKPVRCQLGMETIPIKFGGDAMLPIVAASINGKPTLGVIDLSSPDTTVGKAALEKIGIRPINSFNKVRGVGGSASEYYAKLDEIAVGPAKGKGTFLVYDTNLPEYGIHLGTDYLLRLDLELSFAEKAIRFLLPKNCDDAHLAYWSVDATSVPFTFHNREDLRPEFTIKVDGKEMTALLSTSVENSIIDVLAASRLPGKSSETYSGPGTSRAMGIGKRTLPVWVSPFNTIEIGDEKISNSRMSVMSLEGISADVILGMDFLRSHRVLISMSQRRIYFSYTGGKLFHTGGSDLDWLKAEADAGNVDALYRLGAETAQKGSGASEQSLTWYRKAAALGHLGAAEQIARHEFWLGNYAASAQGLRQVFRDRAPRAFPAAMLFVAAARSGERNAALEELKTLRPRISGSAWGNQILDFHMGKISREKLLQYAVDEEKLSKFRLCEANYQIGQHHLIAGQTEAARLAFEAARDGCTNADEERSLSMAELARLVAAPK